MNNEDCKLQPIWLRGCGPHQLKLIGQRMASLHPIKIGYHEFFLKRMMIKWSSLAVHLVSPYTYTFVTQHKIFTARADRG